MNILTDDWQAYTVPSLLSCDELIKMPTADRPWLTLTAWVTVVRLFVRTARDCRRLSRSPLFYRIFYRSPILYRVFYRSRSFTTSFIDHRSMKCAYSKWSLHSNREQSRISPFILDGTVVDSPAWLMGCRDAVNNMQTHGAAPALHAGKCKCLKITNQRKKHFQFLQTDQYWSCSYSS